MGLKMIYWTPMSGSYFLWGFILEICGKFGKNDCFSRRIWPDWGNTTQADMAGLGSKGLKQVLGMSSLTAKEARVTSFSCHHRSLPRGVE